MDFPPQITAALSLVKSRAYVSKHGKSFLRDQKAEEIIESMGSSANQISVSSHLSILLGSRARYFDRLAEKYLSEHEGCTVLHLGCGLDARAFRLEHKARIWYDIDLPEIIELRKKYYSETKTYKMIAMDLTDPSWIATLKGRGDALVIAEGFSMFLTADENVLLIYAIRDTFDRTEYIFDAYTDQVLVMAGSRNSGARIKGKTICWGLSNPGMLERIPGVRFLKPHTFNETIPLIFFPLGVRMQYRILCGKNSTNRHYKIYQYQILGSADRIRLSKQNARRIRGLAREGSTKNPIVRQNCRRLLLTGEGERGELICDIH
jgi:O-methyltransferase involved in polyketide biosynthesis